MIDKDPSTEILSSVTHFIIQIDVGKLTSEFLIKKHGYLSNTNFSILEELIEMRQMQRQGYSPEEILERIGISDENFEPEMVYSQFFTENN